MTDIKPVIDDQFWFDRSGEMVKDAANRLDTWADRVRDMVVWAFGLYTAGSVLTVEYKRIDEGWILFLLALPYILIILVYWKSQTAKVPIDLTFHPSSPTEIKQAYENAYKNKSEKVNELTRWSFIALFSVSTALVTALIVKNEQRDPKQDAIERYFNGSLESTAEKVHLIVTGVFPPDSLLKIKISRIYYENDSKTPNSEDSSFSILNLHNGVLQHTYVADTATQSIIYAITWLENTYTKTLQKEFVIKPKPKK